MSEKKEDVSDDELDQIIQDMSQEDEPEAEAPKPVADVVPMKKAPTKLESVSSDPVPSAEQRLALEMTGVINLKLSFTQAERSIEVICTEETLICRTADGAEFRIPTGIQKARKAA